MKQKRSVFFHNSFFPKNHRKSPSENSFFPKNHRGQFYLIAAIIIIAVIIGYAAISNYLEKKESIKLYNLGEELGIESENVLDFGTYNEYNESEMDTLLTGFVESYAEYIEEGIAITFIFGNPDKIIVITYEELGGVSSPEIIDPGEEKKVTVTINSIDITFKLKSGENFYFVVSQEIAGEQYVVTS